MSLDEMRSFPTGIGRFVFEEGHPALKKITTFVAAGISLKPTVMECETAANSYIETAPVRSESATLHTVQTIYEPPTEITGPVYRHIITLFVEDVE